MNHLNRPHQPSSMQTSFSLRHIISQHGGQLHGDPTWVCHGIAAIGTAQSNQLTFISNPQYEQQLHTTQAGCVVISPRLFATVPTPNVPHRHWIVTDNPYAYFAHITQMWKALQQAHVLPTPRIHSTAVVAESATIDATAQVGALCVVGERVQIGAHTVLHPKVTIAADCKLGARCVVHSGAVIGADGFGFAPEWVITEAATETATPHWIKIEQIGGVHIGDDVEIGANTCIDRGALSDTTIENGTKLDNLIQIGHNVHIGKHCVIAAATAIAGSAHLGDFCMVGGCVSIAGHLKIASGSVIAGGSVVTGSIAKKGNYAGLFPLDEQTQWRKNAAALKKLASLRDRVRTIEAKLNAKKDN